MPELDPAHVDAALAARYRPEPEDTVPEALGLIAHVLSGGGSDADRARAAVLMKDPEYAESLLVLQQLGPPTPRRAPRWLWAAGPALAAGLLGLLLARPEAGPELVPKGAQDQLQVAVRRGPHRFVASPGQALATGDRLGLFYTSPAAGHLAVFARDAEGAVSTLFPLDAAQGAIEAGVDVALPDGAIVEDGRGCEWIVAIFTEDPLDLEAARGQVAAATEGTDCALDLRVPVARAVRVLPVVRQPR